LREIEEETGLRAQAEQLERLGAVSKVDFRGHPTASVFFLLRGVDPGKLVITEGAAVVLSFAEMAADSRLTETCRRFCTEIAAREAE
jgi:ADP-ribose pyrophosphatase YjhB (NUDIX family)